MSERTEADALDKVPVKVVLGRRTFSIKPQVRKNSRGFRRAFQELTEGADIENLNTNDELIDLVYVYSAELAEAREYIEDNATDEQMVAAFVAITGLALGPFLGVETKVADELRSVGDGSDAERQEKPPASQ